MDQATVQGILNNNIISRYCYLLSDSISFSIHEWKRWWMETVVCLHEQKCHVRQLLAHFGYRSFDSSRPPPKKYVRYNQFVNTVANNKYPCNRSFASFSFVNVQSCPLDGGLCCGTSSRQPILYGLNVAFKTIIQYYNNINDYVLSEKLF